MTQIAPRIHFGKIIVDESAKPALEKITVDGCPENFLNLVDLINQDDLENPRFHLTTRFVRGLAAGSMLAPPSDIKLTRTGRFPNGDDCFEIMYVPSVEREEGQDRPTEFKPASCRPFTIKYALELLQIGKQLGHFEALSQALMTEIFGKPLLNLVDTLLQK